MNPFPLFKLSVSFLAPLCLISLLSGGFLGCAGKEVKEDDPAALFKEADEDLEDGRYQMALDRFRKVKNKFPYSKYSTSAQLKIADVYFKQESFAEAAASYETFVDLYPKHEKASYAMFRVGESYQRDAPSNIARDQSSTQKAIDSYERFLQRFPNAPEASQVKERMTELREVLAEKELYVANFYMREEHYASAKKRYEDLIRVYPESKASKEAREKLVAANKEIEEEEQEKAQEEKAN